MKNNIEVEICTFSLESCLNAQQAGASRVELCSGMYDGGTTPSAAMIRMAREKLSIQLYVMIRPRGGDFLYSDLEFEVMKEDIRFAKACRADGVVLGILNADGSVDVQRTRELVELAAPLKVTFHRAIDMTRNMEEALVGDYRGRVLPGVDLGRTQHGKRGYGANRSLGETGGRTRANYGGKWRECRECPCINGIGGGCHSLEREEQSG